jgi:hypothetical protein
MSEVVKFWSRLSAAVTGAVLALVIPVHAWAASTGVADVATEAARSRRSRGGSGLFILGGVCCLVVVGAIVLVIVLSARRRKRR